MASITSGEMANCDWLRRNFGKRRKKQKHFKAIFQSETVKFKIKTMYRSESEQEHSENEFY